MYLNQKLRVRWHSSHSQYVNVSNGVKQGGVISQILFCIYMDGFLNELANSGVGCYMGGVFAGHRICWWPKIVYTKCEHTQNTNYNMWAVC